MIGITAYGAYIPRLRLARKSAAAIGGWLNPALHAQSKGERSLGNWDEDSITMGVEAARDCFTDNSTSSISSLYFATTTAPFAERLNASIIAEALGLSRTISAFDLTSSYRCGLSALALAWNQAKAGMGDSLIIGSDMPISTAASTASLQQGDAAAAIRIGTDNVVAEILGSFSTTIDFVDHYRGSDQTFNHQWEERWIRDEGFLKLVPETVGQLLEKCGISPDTIDAFICPSTIKGVTAKIARLLGMDDATVEHLEERCGYAGTALPLLLLAQTLETAKPGQYIVVAGFGQGCEALLFKTTDNCESFRPKVGVKQWLTKGVSETNYFKYLVFRDLVEWDDGTHEDVTFSLSAAYRDRRFINNLQGWHCEDTGETFFGPEAEFKISRRDKHFTQKSFTDSTAILLSWSTNYLGFSKDVAICTGIVEFAEGGRLLMNITDVDAEKLVVGLEMKMVYRIHNVDKSRGFTGYFWKAVPADTLHDSKKKNQ